VKRNVSADNTLQTVIGASTTSLLGLPPQSLSDPDSQRIITYLSETFTPNFEALLETMTVKKPNYESPTVSSIVRYTIDGVGNVTSNYASSFIRPMAGSKTMSAEAIASNVRSIVSEALAKVG
jgi:hypothetical protein